MMKSQQITVSATINVDNKNIWNLYTHPAHIVKWNFADPSWHCPAATNDMRIGGKYWARMEAKDNSFGFDFEAIYSEIVEGEKFSYTMADGRNVSVTFKTSKNNISVVTITFDPETENPTDMQRDGWQAILNNFKSYAENNTSH